MFNFETWADENRPLAEAALGRTMTNEDLSILTLGVLVGVMDMRMTGLEYPVTAALTGVLIGLEPETVQEAIAFVDDLPDPTEESHEANVEFAQAMFANATELLRYHGATLPE